MMLRRARIESNVAKRFYFWQEGLRLRRFERSVCREFDLNLTCSELDTKRLQAVSPGVAVAEVPNGVDTEYFRLNQEPERPLSLVFAGNMSWYPNAAAMLFFAEKIWPALKKKLPGVTMDVIGANPSPRLSALAARDRDFRVRGFVPDVRTDISTAALYVCPIKDGGGTKLKILDALAMGRPIVAHPIACRRNQFARWGGRRVCQRTIRVCRRNRYTIRKSAMERAAVCKCTISGRVIVLLLGHWTQTCERNRACLCVAHV